MVAWRIRKRTPACGVCEHVFEDGERHFSRLFLDEEAELTRGDVCRPCWAQLNKDLEAALEVAGRAQLDGADGDSEVVESEEVALVEEPVESGEADSGGDEVQAQVVDDVEAKASDNAGAEGSGDETQSADPEPCEGSNQRTEQDIQNSLALFWWRTKHRTEKRKGLQLNLTALDALFHSLDGRQETKVRELRYLLCLLLMRKRRLKMVKVRRDAEGESFEVRRPRRQESLQVFVFDFTPERMDELRRELMELFDGADEGDDKPEVPAEGEAEASGDSEDSGADEEGDEPADGEDPELAEAQELESESTPAS